MPWNGTRWSVASNRVVVRTLVCAMVCDRTQAADVDLKDVDEFPHSSPSLSSLDQAIGRLPRRAIVPGTALTAALVDEPVDIEAGAIRHGGSAQRRRHCHRRSQSRIRRTPRKMMSVSQSGQRKIISRRRRGTLSSIADPSIYNVWSSRNETPDRAVTPAGRTGRRRFQRNQEATPVPTGLDKYTVEAEKQALSTPPTPAFGRPSRSSPM